MSEYWKSIPRKYCQFCKAWYQDNKSSVDFHEKGFKHKANVQKHLQEVQRRGAKALDDKVKYDAEIAKIESAAIAAYQKDVAKDPMLAALPPMEIKMRELQKREEIEESIRKKSSGRFGDESSQAGPSDSAKKEALDMVAKKLSKKHDWFESKTAEGKQYFFNKVTQAVRWNPPKCGFIALGEQEQLSLVNVPGDQSNQKSTMQNQKFKHEQFGKWETVETKKFQPIDLQLPITCTVKPPQVCNRKEEPEEFKFEEKAITQSVKSSRNQESTFKKRRNNEQNKRNIRQRTDED